MQLVFPMIANLCNKLPRQEDNKETFRTSSQAATCLTLGGGFIVFSFTLNVMQGSCEYQFLYSSLWFDLTGNQNLSLPFQ